jgi:antitoxin (DNA-binding transcriptional repressor) of toxin-antitoxin stability system
MVPQQHMPAALQPHQPRPGDLLCGVFRPSRYRRRVILGMDDQGASCDALQRIGYGDGGVVCQPNFPRLLGSLAGYQGTKARIRSITMVYQVSYRDAVARLKDLIEAAIRGEIVYIAEDDQHIVQLIPVSSSSSTRLFGSAKGQIQIEDDFDAPLEEFQEY